MIYEYKPTQRCKYVMNWQEGPYHDLEPIEREIEVVDEALEALVEANILPHKRYDKDRMFTHRTAVRENFEIPWTGITPRMEHLLYAINAIAQPQTVVAVGILTRILPLAV